MRTALTPVLLDDRNLVAARQQPRRMCARRSCLPGGTGARAHKRTATICRCTVLQPLVAELGMLTANTMQIVESGAAFFRRWRSPTRPERPAGQFDK